MIGSLVAFGIALFAFCTWGWQNLRYCLPLLTGRRGRFWFDGGPEAITNQEWSGRTQEILGGLEDLGFRPLGIKVESFPLRTGSEIAFAAPEKRAFASIHGYLHGTPHYYFYTPFEDGSVVLTSGFPHAGARTDGFTHVGTSATGMAAVLADHEQNVQEMARPGRQPCRQYDQQARIRATEAYYDHPGCGNLTGRLRLKALQNVGVSLLFLLATGAFAVWKWLPFIAALKLFQ